MQNLQEFRLFSSIEGMCLLALMQEPMCGYAIMTFIYHHFGEAVAHPIIYRKLYLLEQAGYIMRSSNLPVRPRQKNEYTILQKGKDWLIAKRQPVLAAYELMKDIA